MKYKVYIAKLKRTNKTPHIVFKVGITKSADALDRLLYDGVDEPHPIKKYFSDIKVMKSRWMSSRTEALNLEKHLMNTIQQNEKSFHNWWEKDHISGITECRIWNYEEFKKCCGLMDSYKEKEIEEELKDWASL
jgi:hypothetical protein